ncbi:MAG TPA: glycosyltransferase [Thermoleophilaceae bacterium]|nr:glycosyltransferase [Thermoleophilaceae bacterium]
MRIALFCHSLVSDWNHGSVHFLRGVVAELLDRGHDVRAYEPGDGWSRQNLLEDRGEVALEEIHERFPWMASVVREYEHDSLDVDEALDGAELVLVHDTSEPPLVARIGARRAAGATFRLLFHDTHHRAVTAPDEIAGYDLSEYDGVLAFGEVLRRIYLERGWAERAWTWHEAADTRVFRPLPDMEPEADLVWICNWGDGERGEELRDFMLRPARRLRLRGTVHGVRYPWRGRLAVRLAGLRYRGRLANHRAPAQFARHRVTVHVPRRPYARALPGIPTIRPFEALACGIPLVCAPWDDAEGLFRPGEDLLIARDGNQMCHQLDAVLHDSQLAKALRDNGLETIAKRHTCAHRVDELLGIARELGVRAQAPA